MKSLVALITIIISVFLFNACGKDSPAQKTGADQPSAASAAGEIEDYNLPDDVDAGVFKMLRDEFQRLLKENPETCGRLAEVVYAAKGLKLPVPVGGHGAIAADASEPETEDV
ncbi:MAG: hypothetical protein IH973_15205 [Myxococcales bacterium]|nr:hypothetical protein [Myxococcales bacterium]